MHISKFMLFLRTLVAVTILALLCTSAFALQSNSIRGEVRDRNRRPIAGARITVPVLSIGTASDAEGRFVLEVGETTSADVNITAPGFAPLAFEWRQGFPSRVWFLQLPGVTERITVSGESNTRAIETLSSTQLQTSPAPNLDSTLRQIAGFELFRRSPSWSSNPTTQGVSLRGAGASGASRSVVALNGVPLNDPFGGWIYWGRVPPSTLNEVTVAKGGAAEIYGTQALGGAIELTRPTPENSHATVEAYAGNLFTGGTSLLAGTKLHNWSVAGGLASFRTDGYVPVAPDVRGPIDANANSRSTSGWLQLDRNFERGMVFVGGNLYGESRHNGTQLQINGATIRELQAGMQWSSPRLGDLRARVYGGTENLRQTFSAINPDRTIEALTRTQSVPASQIGAFGLWSKVVSPKNTLTLGGDAGRIVGDSDELAFFEGALTGRTISGGTQVRFAGSVGDQITLSSHAIFSAALRFDRWSNTDARSLTIPIQGPPQHTSLPTTSATAFSPRIGFSYSFGDRIVLQSSASAAFRAPTLNELYRGFRLGNVVTLANPTLTPERQAGVEAGLVFTASTNHTVSGTAFWSTIYDPIVNLTLSITPSLITRQRQNLGSLNSKGFDLGWKARWRNDLSSTLGYQFADATVASFPADPSFVGLWVPQVSRHNIVAAVRYELPQSWTVSVEGRYQGRQYDDDRNLFPLGGYFQANLFLSRRLPRGVTLFAAVENLTNRRCEVARTPVLSLGPPILARLGFRWTFDKR